MISASRALESRRKEMNDIWKKLYDAALTVLCPRKVSSIIEAGGVAAA